MWVRSTVLSMVLRHYDPPAGSAAVSVRFYWDRASTVFVTIGCGNLGIAVTVWIARNSSGVHHLPVWPIWAAGGWGAGFVFLAILTCVRPRATRQEDKPSAEPPRPSQPGSPFWSRMEHKDNIMPVTDRRDPLAGWVARTGVLDSAVLPWHDARIRRLCKILMHAY